MVTIKQKPVVDTQQKMRKESKYNAQISHQSTMNESKKRIKGEELQKQKPEIIKNIALSTHQYLHKCKWIKFFNLNAE